MPESQQIFSDFILLWGVIDPIGTVLVLISATNGRSNVERRRIGRIAALVAAGILLFFIVFGEIVLRARRKSWRG